MTNSRWDEHWTEEAGSQEGVGELGPFLLQKPSKLRLGTEIPQNTVGFGSQIYWVLSLEFGPLKFYP